MKIALLHYSMPPVVGGVESVIAHQARLMQSHGQTVRLLAGRGEGWDQSIPFRSIPLVDSQHPDILAVKARLDLGLVPPQFYELRDQLVALLQTALADIDVLIGHNICSLNKNLVLTAALYALHQTARLPRLVLWHHDLAWTTPRYRSELHTGYPWDLLRSDWPGVTQVVVSDLRRRELADLMRIDPERIRVIPNGVDVVRFYKLETATQQLLTHTRLLAAAPILLLPVRITPRKNIELALRVLARLRRDWPEAALVVTGPLGPHNTRNRQYFEQLLALRVQLGLVGSAHFLVEYTTEFLPDAVVADFYRLADALFMPSREEGFGIPLLEAALSHLPVFCADIPPLCDLGLNAAQYFSPDSDPAEVAALISDYLQKSETTWFAQRARVEYSWDAVYHKRIAPLLESVG
jgi:glycosyltransferase involved in cell wall biosynthesis